MHTRRTSFPCSSALSRCLSAAQSEVALIVAFGVQAAHAGWACGARCDGDSAAVGVEGEPAVVALGPAAGCGVVLGEGCGRVDLNIVALNSHDGTSAFRLLVTSIRVVCANTQAAALREHKASISIRHTRNAKAAVQTAREALGLTFACVHEFEAEAGRIINTTMTDAAFANLTATVFGTPIVTPRHGREGRAPA